MSHVSEFTVEVNPGTITEVWIRTMRSLGVNRVSVGVQSADNQILSLLGRIHQFEEVPPAIDLIRSAGITNISTDLIFGIPGQTAESWEQTLHAVLSLSPAHISAYGLIPEEGTPLKNDLDSGKLTLPDPDTEREMYAYAVRVLRQHGYDRYEISNFAKEDCACRHNIGYWTLVPYLGLGLSAASMTGMQKQGDGITYRRTANPSGFDAYERLLLHPDERESEFISSEEARFESLMLGFRMDEGVSEDSFYFRHGISLDACYGNKLRSFESRGLIRHESGRWFLTDRGMDIQNSILVELME